MDSRPLILKSNKSENHDVSHIIGEVFQDILGRRQLPKNVAENAGKYNLDNEDLKANGDRVLSVYNSTKLTLADIGFVEDNIMTGHGSALKKQNVVDNDPIVKEFSTLKCQGAFSDLDSNEVGRYGLLQKLDLLPSRPERSMDFRINSNRHICPSPCPSALDLYPVKLSKSKIAALKCTDLQNKGQNLVEKGLSQLDESGRIRKPFKCEEDQSSFQLIPEEVILKQYTTPPTENRNIIFQAEPEVVTFYDYEKGITYKKTFKLRNVSKVTQSFTPRTLPKTTYFRVELQTGTTRVAPGICVIFLVKYKTDIYKDVEDVMVFNTYSGCDAEVRLKSYRKPPDLKAYIIKTRQHFLNKCPLVGGATLFGDKRSVALNSTIDCGSCLLGGHVDLSVVLVNNGNKGKFFLLSEDNWFFSNVSDVDKNLILTSHCFAIYPAYFALDANKALLMSVRFSPIHGGLSVAKLFLLCDNNTKEELEIVGDGAAFEMSNIVIDANEKPENFDALDIKSTYYIYLGECIAHEKYSHTLTVHNNSIVSYHYKWVMRKSTSHQSSKRKFRHIHTNWLEIDFISETLPNESTTDFKFTVHCGSKKPGWYSMVLGLYLLNIPLGSLCYNTLYRSKTEELPKPVDPDKYFDICIGEIELLYELTPIKVMFDPQELLIPRCEKLKEEFVQRIQLYTINSTPLKCEWVAPRRVQVFPSTFVLQPNTNFHCTIVVELDKYLEYQCQLTFRANGNLFVKEYLVKPEPVKPTLEFSTTMLDFGVIEQGQPAPAKDFYLRNTGPELVTWEILELCYDFKRRVVVEADLERRVAETRGILFGFKQCKLTYRLDKTDAKDHGWFSFIIVFALLPKLEAMGSVCLVRYQLVPPRIVIHTPSSPHPILYPGRMLYVGCKSYYNLCLHNTGNSFSSYVWQQPVGKHAKYIKIQVYPESGDIEPKKCVHVIVSLEPLKTGIMDDVYIPCLVGFIKKSIELTILCAVDNIHVNFHLPRSDGRTQIVFWPPKVTQDSIMEFKILKDINPRFQENMLTSVTALESTSIASINASQDMEESVVEEDMSTVHLISEASSTTVETMTSAPTTEASKASTIPLQDHFGSDLILHEYMFEYRDVPTRTPTKKTIIIENLTPIAGSFDITMVNFSAMGRVDDGNQIMAEILDKLNVKKNNEWAVYINRKLGIVVKTTPAEGTITSYHSVEVDIWVYATTWGVYAEEILIKVADVLPFAFNLLIEVVGAPIAFPIARNSSFEPIIRFGNLSYSSPGIMRKLTILNHSCVPLCLSWHVFMPHEDSSIKQNPFNVFVDTLPLSDFSKNSDFMKLMVTPKYHGEEDWKIVRVVPRTVTVDPKTVRCVTVFLFPKYYPVKHSTTEIHACLISYIHLQNKFKYRSNVYSRPTAVELAPVQVNLHARLEMPLLDLELLKGDVRITAYVKDVLDAEELSFERLLVFRNAASAAAVVLMHISKPFKIVSVRTAHIRDEKNRLAATVLPGECAEVLVKCTIDSEQVLQYSDMIYNEKTTVFPEEASRDDHTVTVRRCLNIHQFGVKQQSTDMELVLFYPRFKISHQSIDFGTVFIGNTKKMLLVLSNFTGSELPYTVNQRATHNVTVIKPISGVIPKAYCCVPSTVTLSLYFTPRECESYEETIRITTNIPLCDHTVILTGAGSNNEKLYVEGM